MCHLAIDASPVSTRDKPTRAEGIPTRLAAYGDFDSEILAKARGEMREQRACVNTACVALILQRRRACGETTPASKYAAKIERSLIGYTPILNSTNSE